MQGLGGHREHWIHSEQDEKVCIQNRLTFFTSFSDGAGCCMENRDRYRCRGQVKLMQQSRCEGTVPRTRPGTEHQE